MTHASESSKLTRRGVLGADTGLAAITIVPRHVLGGPGRTAPSDTPCVGGVGIGGVGHGQIQQCAAAGLKVVALCDVDDKLADRTAAKFPQCVNFGSCSPESHAPHLVN